MTGNGVKNGKATGSASTLTMLPEWAVFGSGDLGGLLATAPTMPNFDVEPLEVPGAEMLQVLYETAPDAALPLLPPSLGGVRGAFVSWRGLHLPETPWGPTTIAEARVLCRAGFRPRLYVVEAFTDQPKAIEPLRAGWGFPLRLAEHVSLRRFHDKVNLVVRDDGRTVLDVSMIEPMPTAPNAIGINASVHLVNTPAGGKIVQAGADFVFQRAEIGRPRLDAYEPAAWADGSLVANWPVSAVAVQADVTLREIQFVSDTDRPALFGTKKIR